MQNAEARRLAQDAVRARNWKRWGPYLSERQWGTVREDYSANGNCWEYLPFEHARSRAYRWGEDGLLGITDRECRLCFALALWNGRDPILKERLFGLSNHQGNHGEDAKECYFYIASTPTHSYMKALYKYPQAEFPYERLIAENARRNRNQPEFELEDTGIFDDSRYFDIFAEYAKAAPDDILIRITVANRGPERATLHLLPTLWFRNTWSWGRSTEPQPRLSTLSSNTLLAEHPTLGNFKFVASQLENAEPLILFTENETNFARLFNSPNPQAYVKDAFHDYIIARNTDAVSSGTFGTKAALVYQLNIAPGQEIVLRFRLFPEETQRTRPLGPRFDAIFATRIKQCEAFYGKHLPDSLSSEEKNVAMQAWGGLLWTKQYYYYVIREWLEGDPTQPQPPPSRKTGRNCDWIYLYNSDVISMPDKWEYPWYASWDLAFHLVAMAGIDPDFAKDQAIRFLREWYMHPSGQLPAYEFEFSDVNPPVHAWAAWRIYKIAADRSEERDRMFLERVFQKLLLNFTWWVNRKDPDGNNLFTGGFLGLDNIGVFDRSKSLPSGGTLRQADATAWMAFYCGTMLSIALELAQDHPAYEDMASKFFEHYIGIADSMNCFGGTGLWDEEDGFYYDQLRMNGQKRPLQVRSLVGLIPLIAVENISCPAISRLSGFSKRLDWFLDNRQDLARHISYMQPGDCPCGKLFLLAIPSRQRLERVLRYMLDENEFLSPYGLRSVSRYHRDNPYCLCGSTKEFRVEYEPGESSSGLFGGNSNWRGPIWFPINYLIIEALERYHHFYGETLQVECPTGSGKMMNLKQVAAELNHRLCRLFLADANSQRPSQGLVNRYATDPNWKDLLLFHEYFHGETGLGLGASHQTGWTALVARCLVSR